MGRRDHFESTVERFWSKVDRKGPDDCWLWTGAKQAPNGCGLVYGNFGITVEIGSTCSYRAHRFAWFLTNGEIPEGAMIRHSCDTPLCCNPAHLEPGTARDNIMDAIERGRASLGELNPNSKLTADQVIEIRKAPKSIKSVTLAKQYGVHPTHIGRLRKGEKWQVLDSDRHEHE